MSLPKVAQQDAQRAQFIVEKAIQEKQQKVVQAEGEAEAARLLGEAMSANPGYLKLRKIRAAQNIARTVSISFSFHTVHCVISRDSLSKIFFFK